MKTLAVNFIRVYQVVFSTLLKNLLGVPRFCRFNTTCSEYAVDSLEKYGFVKGGRLSLARILKCQPFYKGGVI